MAAFLTRFYNSVMKKLLWVILLPVLLFGEPHEWTNTQGQTIKAEFVSATHEAVTISMQGKVFVVKLADLSPQSRALAAKLRVQKSTVQENEAQDEAGLSSPAPPGVKAAEVGFMGVQSRANRIAFIVDYSLSMKGMDKVMRAELEAAVNKIAPVDILPDKEVYNSVCLIFFSGPSWLAGENASEIQKKWTGDNANGFRPKRGFEPRKPQWLPVTPSSKKMLSKAIWDTPLAFGSAWDNSFRWALTKLDPKPDVIYFMTNGFVGVAEGRKGMEVIKTHRGSTKIYTIGYGTPSKVRIPLQEIADMTGGKAKFFSMDQIRNMEKKIKRK
jgi:hypothetical protein